MVLWVVGHQKGNELAVEELLVGVRCSFNILKSAVRLLLEARAVLASPCPAARCEQGMSRRRVAGALFLLFNPVGLRFGSNITNILFVA